MILTSANAIKAARDYSEMFREEIDTDRFVEIANLINGCATMDDVEDLSDPENGTISGGEFSAISCYITE